jgi:hypothetical protein
MTAASNPSAAEPSRTRMKDWALLAYFVGDHKGEADSLDDALASELKAICDAADFERMSVAVQVDFRRRGNVIRATLTEPPARPLRPQDERPEDNPLSRKLNAELKWPRRWLSVSRQLFQRIGKRLKQMFLRLIEKADGNAASENVLKEFLQFGRKACPARRYLIYFFGHAYGPMGLFLDNETLTRPPNSLRLNDLADAIESEGGHAAIVLFRDCFMGTLETAFQLKSCADFLLASQAEAPIAGVWPWDQFMSALVAGGTSLDVGKELSIRLTTFLRQVKNRRPLADVPYALLDLSVAPRLVETLKRLVHALEGARPNDLRRIACSKALEAARIGSPMNHSAPGDPSLIDVVTFCANLEALAPDPVAQPAKQLADVLRTLVRFSFTLLGGHKGVSLYYRPVTADDRETSFIEARDPEEGRKDRAQYRKLALCEESEWGRFALDPLSPS